MLDEYPGQAFLTDTQVRKLLAYRDRREWNAFLEMNPDFPERVEAGRSRNGKPRLLFLKGLVYAWISLRKPPRKVDKAEEKTDGGARG